MVRSPGHVAFREFALYYHEIGTESFQLRDKNGGLVAREDRDGRC